MTNQKPGIPQGTRDFGPEQMVKRTFILNTIKNVFQKFGFLPLETPAMENLSVLTGKYGEEGDRLIYKILNSGDFLSKASEEDWKSGSKAILPKIAEKGLRYDLTVPFARYVVMNRNEITFPFKRYQVQPVWRADRPQKGRYREFYQCDADVVGTDSLICEAEIILMIHEVFTNLGIKDFTLKLNNRKILSGIVDAIGEPGRETDFCVAVDKLDKIGEESVLNELRDKNFSETSLNNLAPFLKSSAGFEDQIKSLKSSLHNSEIGMKGIEEIENIYRLTKAYNCSYTVPELDITLARGLTYYTGAIFEVKANNVKIGSIGGGGRYDNLTGVFGMPGISGVGFSFGVDRIYDVMEELGLFTAESQITTSVMVACFDEESFQYGLQMTGKLRAAGIKCEIFPELAKLKKQFNYADKKSIPLVIISGPDEIKSGIFTVKNMTSGEQESLSIEEIIMRLT